MEGKVSFHDGKEHSIKHNMREFDRDEWNKDGHIDYSRSQYNEVLVNKDEKEFFAEIFGDAVEEYNEKIKKKYPDRVKTVEQYYNSQKKNIRESIIQLSDSDNFKQLCEEQGFDKAVEIHKAFLKDVLKDWQERNPSLKIFSATIHCDESTPHLHLDYIPVAESTRGQKVKLSLEGALKSIGFKREEDQAYGETPLTRWRNAERKRIEEIGGKYIEVIPSEPSTKGHQEYWQYKYEIEKEKGIKGLLNNFRDKPDIETAKKIIEVAGDVNEVMCKEGRAAQDRARVEQEKAKREWKKAQSERERAETAKQEQARAQAEINQQRQQIEDERNLLKRKGDTLDKEKEEMDMTISINARTQAENIIRNLGYSTNKGFSIDEQMRVARNIQRDRWTEQIRETPNNTNSERG